MASIYPHRGGYRAQVYVNKTRDSECFQTRREAAQWALQREAELSGRKLPDKSFTDAIKEYEAHVAPTHRGSRWEFIRLKSLRRDDLAKRKLAGLSSDDFEKWRDRRLTEVKPGSVARELNLIRGILEFARKPRRWIIVNPLEDVRWPETPKGRRRRVTEDEIKLIRQAFGLANGLRGVMTTQRVGLAFLFAIETGMRSGEILALTPATVHLPERYVRVATSKNGDARDVPLSQAAVAILKALPEVKADEAVFAVGDRMRDALWRKNRPAALADLHFHDSRAEAIWRLSKKLDVLQLARVIGHNDIKSLLHYYQPTASELAAQLG